VNIVYMGIRMNKTIDCVSCKYFREYNLFHFVNLCLLEYFKNNQEQLINKIM